MKKILLIYNPNAGDEKGSELLETIERKLKENFEEVIIKETKDAGHATELAKEYKDIESLAVFGGDGTINEVLLGMYEAESHAKLLIIPAGTGNLLAKKLDIPENPEEALNAFSFNKTKKIDLGKCGDHVFSMFASIGAIPEAIHEVSSEEKSKFGGLAYIKKSVEKLLDSHKCELEITSDGGEYSGEVDHLMVCLSNKIGKLEFTKENKDMDNGLAHVLILTDDSVKDRLEVLRASVAGEVEDVDKVVNFKAKKISIKSLDGDVKVDIDGDEGPKLPVDIEIINKAVEVYIPDLNEV